MDSDNKSLPPPYEEADSSTPPKYVLDPVTLILNGQFVETDTKPRTALYHTDWSLTSIPPKGSSMIFERTHHVVSAEGSNSDQPSTSKQTGSRHLFYLVHPAGAKFNSTPGYYITSVPSPSSTLLGNISLDETKSKLQKPEFRAMLSPLKNASDADLFVVKPQLLFEAKAKLLSGRYSWTDAEGAQLAHEDGKGDDHRLVITASMNQELRDALVATWCLRLWHDVAESRQAKKQALEDFTPAEAMLGYGGSMGKRMGAAGALAGVGAG